MSIFGGLFGKKEPEPPKYVRPSFETELGRFVYTGDPERYVEEVGYESELVWYDDTEEDDLLMGVYIDSDTRDSLEAGRCYGILAGIVADKVRIDHEVRLTAARHYADKDGFVMSDGMLTSAEAAANKFQLTFISVYRDGRVVYSVDLGYALDEVEAGHLHVTVAADGSVSVEECSY